jgi:DNA-binding transcriptional regulator YiaG
MMSSERQCWHNMIARCENPKVRGHYRYGGRGISVCPRWRNSFDAFLADMGPMPSPKHQIEREDNDGNYELGNCRWATKEEQANNTSRCVYLEHDGKRLTIMQWSRLLGVDYSVIQYRVSAGWSNAEALTVPSSLSENVRRRDGAVVSISPADFRAARVAKGFSRSGLARLAGVSVSNISDYERGKFRLRESLYRKVCQHLGWPETVRALNAAAGEAR